MIEKHTFDLGGFGDIDPTTWAYVIYVNPALDLAYLAGLCGQSVNDPKLDTKAKVSSFMTLCLSMVRQVYGVRLDKVVVARPALDGPDDIKMVNSAMIATLAIREFLAANKDLVPDTSPDNTLCVHTVDLPEHPELHELVLVQFSNLDSNWRAL